MVASFATIRNAVDGRDAGKLYHPMVKFITMMLDRICEWNLL